MLTTENYLNVEIGLVLRNDALDGAGNVRQMVLQVTGLFWTLLVANKLAIGPLHPWARSFRQQYLRTHWRL